MFKKLLSKLSGAPAAAPTPERHRAPQDPASEALLRAVEAQRKTDPYIGAKIGGKEVLHRLMSAFKNERGVHVESVLSALGALAGYACQADLRARALAAGQPEKAVFMVVETAKGQRYFFGDALNRLLVEEPISVWGLAAGAAQHLGCSPLPDVQEMFAHVAKTVGEADFGVPRIPEDHRPSDLPAGYLKTLWPALLPVLKTFCKSPAEWPLLYASAIQNLMEMAKDVLGPELALRIVMESAIPMSKVDLQAL